MVSNQNGSPIETSRSSTRCHSDLVVDGALIGDSGLIPPEIRMCTGVHHNQFW
jgi:hypothetical protein